MLHLSIKKIINISIGMGIALTFSAHASDQYKSNVNRVYDLSKQIRNLPNAKHPAYRNLIKECRDSLYIAMSDLAQYNDWDALGSTLPGPEICSFTGVVLEKTTAEYEEKLMQAKGNTRVSKRAAPTVNSSLVHTDTNATSEKLNESEKIVTDFYLTGIDFNKLIKDQTYNKIVYENFLKFLEDKQKFNSNQGFDVSSTTKKCIEYMEKYWANNLSKDIRKLKKILAKSSCYEIIEHIVTDQDFAEMDIDLLNEIIPYLDKTDLSASWNSAYIKLNFKDKDTGRAEALWHYLIIGHGRKAYKFPDGSHFPFMTNSMRVMQYKPFLDSIE